METGTEVSANGDKFTWSNKDHFNKNIRISCNNMVVMTAFKNKEYINKQSCISIMKDIVQFDVPVIIVTT